LGYYFDREIGKTWVIFLILKNSFDIDSMCGANKIKIQQHLAPPVMRKKKKEK
jgi:hypothetical protein